MHLTDIRIHEIVDVAGLPGYARGTAIFSNGRGYEFHANFAHGYGDECVTILRPTDRRHRLTQTRRASEAIQQRLGFAEIASREHDAIAAFEYERVTACKELMSGSTS
ncbi:MAG: hypothetical protein OXE50_06525 [Chloroflexi bacterium]|nr:hypothetical protein [Chloroflexota bacterium]